MIWWERGGTLGRMGCTWGQPRGCRRAAGQPPTWVLDWIAARYPGCVYRMPLESPVVALTLGDGPDATTVPLILAELRRYEAQATFFLITERVRGREQLVRQLVAEGHELANHFTQDLEAALR